MTEPAYGSFAQWYSEGHLASYVRAIKSPGGMLDLLEAAQPAGDMSDPATPDLVLYQDLSGGSRVSDDLGAGRFDVLSQKRGFFLAAPNFANTVLVEDRHRLRSLSFPVSQWKDILEEASDGCFSFGSHLLYRGTFQSQRIGSAILHLWRLCDEAGVPSRLLAQSAGCRILAELCRLTGFSLVTAKGGLASWAEQRSVDLMRARISEDVSLDELAAEARLSTFHFSRMFKRTVGISPMVYMARLRVEKACELLERSELPITQIAQEVGYSSSQVLARVFFRHKHMSPSDYRRARGRY